MCGGGIPKKAGGPGLATPLTPVQLQKICGPKRHRPDIGIALRTLNHANRTLRHDKLDSSLDSIPASAFSGKRPPQAWLMAQRATIAVWEVLASAPINRCCIPEANIGEWTPYDPAKPADDVRC